MIVFKNIISNARRRSKVYKETIMFNKTKNKAGIKFGVKYNPNTEDVDFTLDLTYEQENVSQSDNQLDFDEQPLIEEE